MEREKKKWMTAFLAEISHEIATPINGIIGFAELLKNPALNRMEQDKYINIIEKSGSQLLTLVNNLVSISTIEEGKMKVSGSATNINEVIEYIYSFFKQEAGEKGIELIIQQGLPLKDAIIYADQNIITSILINLVKNAIKFTEKGIIKIGYVKSENSLIFFVKDTGIGMKKSQLDIIFEREMRLDLKYPGKGLGLFISKAYVKLLGGKIWVESKRDEGSEFYFTVPYSFVGKEKIKRNGENDFQKQPDTNGKKGLKILLAEDDEFSELLIRELLNKFAREIITVKSGISAVDYCRSNPDTDLVLLDVRIPEMNGFESARQIRLLNHHVVIVAQTAITFSSDWEKAVNAGCNDYISKPLTRKLMEGLLKKHFGPGIIKQSDLVKGG